MRLILACLLALFAFAAPAMAAKPLPATLSVSPDPVGVYETFTITGCGYTADSTVRFVAQFPGGTSFWGGNVGSDGCLAPGTTGWATATPGTTTLEAFEGNNRKPSGRTTFEIN